MSYLDTLRNGIATADSMTRSLQATVSFYRCTGIDNHGTRTYASAVSLLAVVDGKQSQIRTMTGELTMCRATLTFLNIVALSAATGGLGVTVQDKIVLQDGTTSPILNVGGFVDAATGHAIATEVYLG